MTNALRRSQNSPSKLAARRSDMLRDQFSGPHFTRVDGMMHIGPHARTLWYGSHMQYPFRPAPIVGVIAALPLFAIFLSSISAQQASQTPGQEVVASLAAGRVVIAVVKDAILIATVENPIEADTRPPAPVEIDSSRVGIMLGPIDWFSPSTQQEIARLDRELPHLKTRLVITTPHLGQVQVGDEAADIEATGQGLGERLNQVAKGLRSKVNLPADEPLAELIMADYVGGYGAEVWQLLYGMKQEQQKGDYWETRVLRPSYTQFWPPEKGQPKTLMEFNYPVGNAPPSLLQLLRQKDPRLEKIRNSDPQMALVATQIQTDSSKLLAGDATQFLRAAVAAIVPPNARETMAIIGMEKGFAWVLPPPAEPERPKPAQTAQGEQQQQKERPADAPSLLKH